MAAITKKDTSPIVALIANLCCFGILGYVLIGQTNKGLFTFIVALVLSFVGVGFIVSILGLIDVYQVAEAIQRGETIDENEYKLEILYKIMSIVDKNAIYKG